MNISNRLKSVANMVAFKTCVDVGTDHGYVPIYLCLNNICDYVIAMDINRGPLSVCFDNIQKYRLSDRIYTRLCDGLSDYDAGEAETVVISGMGGLLIEKILSRDIELAKSFKQLVLSPQGDEKVVRKFLKENGFIIEKEDMIFDEGKYYLIIDARFYQNDTKSDEKLLDEELSDDEIDNKNDIEIDNSKEDIETINEDENDHEEEKLVEEIKECFGEYLVENKNKVFVEYVTKEHRNYSFILECLKEKEAENKVDSTKNRMIEIEKYVNLLEKTMDIMGVSYERGSKN